MARRIVIFMTAIFATLGIGVAALLLWVTSESGSQQISKRLRLTILDRTGVEILFDQIELDIFPPRIRVQGIDAKRTKGELSCSIEEAELTPDWLDLFSGILSIEEVYLGSPRCRVKLDKDTLDQTVFAEDKTDTPFELKLSALPEFDVFAVSNAALEVDITDPGRLGHIRGAASGFGLDVTRDKGGMEIRGLLGAANGSWQDDDKRAAEEMRELTFRAALTDESVDIRYLKTAVAGGTINLRDAHIPLPLWPSGPDVAEIAVNMPLDVLNRLPFDLPVIKGTAAYRGQVSARRDGNNEIGWYARGQIKLTGIAADDFVLGDLDAHAAFTPQGVAFEKTELHAADGVLKMAGNIAFDDTLTTELDLDLDNIELAHLLEQVTLQGTYVTQRMSGPAKLKGQLNPFRLSGNVRIDVRDHTTLTGSFRDKTSDTALYIPKTFVKGNVTITDEYFEGKNLQASSGNSRVGVDMRINYDSLDWYLKAASDDLYLEDIQHIMGFQVAGHGPVFCHIFGKLNNPEIKGNGTFENAVIEGMDFAELSTDVSFHDLILAFDKLSVRRGASRASSKELTLDFTSDAGLVINTKIEAQRVAIEELFDLFEIDRTPWGSPTGLLFGRVAVAYDLGSNQLRVNADVVHDELSAFGEDFGTDVLRVDWNDGDLTINEFGVTKGNGSISVTGAVRADQSISFIGVARGVEAAGINYETVRALGVDAPVNAFVIVEGTLDHPSGSINLDVGELTHRRVRYGPSSLAMTIDGPVVSGSGNVAGEQVMLEHLELNLKKDRFSVEGFANAVDLVPLLGLESDKTKTVLEITGDMALSGRFAADPRLRGRAKLIKVKAQLGDLEFENTKKAAIRVKANQFNISPTRFSGDDVAFDLSGIVGLDTINLKIAGNAKLASVSSMVDGISKTDGNLAFELRATGDVSNPTLRGDAAVTGGMVRISKFPHDVTHIQGRATFSPNGVRFYDFTADIASGTASMSGDIGLEDMDIEDYRFNLQASDLALTPFDDLTFKVSTVQNGLTLTSGTRGGLPKVTGDAEVRDLRYTSDIRVLELSDLNVDRLSGTRATTKKPKLIDPKKDFFAFDIRLHGEDNLEAHNNLFDVDLVIDDLEKTLRFVGTNQTFGFKGRILGKRGRVRFAGRRFDIRYAAVDFRDPERLDNPNFQVVADGTIRDWKVTMTAEGTVENYEIKLASQPFLQQEDIAFLILTGLTQAENRQFGRSGFNLGMPFLGQLGPGGGELPVELQVYSEYSENAGTDTTRIAMGRWITEDVWVSVSSAVGQTRDVEAQVDYKINDEFSVSAGYEDEDEGSTGNVGLDLKFRLEF